MNSFKWWDKVSSYAPRQRKMLKSKSPVNF